MSADEQPYEYYRDAALNKAAWAVVQERKASGHEVDRDEIVQNLWVWLLSEGRDGKTGDDRLRRLLSPEMRRFKRSVRELAAVGRRPFTNLEYPIDPLPEDDGGDDEPLYSLLDTTPAARPPQSSHWPSPASSAVAALPSPDRDILEMSAEGFNATEIADVLDLSPANVRQRRKRVLDRLREDLAA